MEVSGCYGWCPRSGSDDTRRAFYMAVAFLSFISSFVGHSFVASCITKEDCWLRSRSFIYQAIKWLVFACWDCHCRHLLTFSLFHHKRSHARRLCVLMPSSLSEDIYFCTTVRGDIPVCAPEDRPPSMTGRYDTWVGRYTVKLYYVRAHSTLRPTGFMTGNHNATLLPLLKSLTATQNSLTATQKPLTATSVYIDNFTSSQGVRVEW